MRKLAMLLSAAAMLAGIVPAGAASGAGPAKFRLPPPTAPRDQVYSPGAVARDLERRGYRIEKMKRKGTTYSITATGPSGNRVQMTLDGSSGDIVGLAVLQATASLASAIADIVRTGKGARYVDDWHPFGIIVPDTYQSRWTVIPAWNVYTTEYVTEVWSGAGYRFAVPYDSVRPGHNGFSVTTFAAAELGDPIYDVYEFNGAEISTDDADETWEIAATQSFEDTWGAQNERMEAEYLDGTIDEVTETELGDVEDYDSEDGDFSMADAEDDYDGGFGDAGDGGDDGDEVDDGHDDYGHDDSDYEDDGSDDFGDDGDDDFDDGSDDYDDEPERLRR